MLPKDIDLSFLIEVEVGGNLAVASKLHWPKNDASGPTISIGIDLGYLTPTSFNRIFGKILTTEQYTILQKGIGIKGPLAGQFVKANQSVTLSKQQIMDSFAIILDDFWNSTKKRYSGIDSMPGCVKTACLSIGYNRGVFNSDEKMKAFDAAIEAKNWKLAASIVDTMQEGTFWQKRLGPVYRGLNIRRDKERNLILKAV